MLNPLTSLQGDETTMGIMSCRDFACIWGYATSPAFFIAVVVFVILAAVFKDLIGKPIANWVKPYLEWTWQTTRRAFGWQLAPDLTLDLSRCEPMSQERPLMQRIALAYYQTGAVKSVSEHAAIPISIEMSGIKHSIPLLRYQKAFQIPLSL